MNKVVVVCFLFLFAVTAQSQNQEPYKYLGNYTQPAPNAASLGKFVDYPVSYYTGVPEISIPLYDLQDGAAKTSISLSYHASGIRVAELSSWVGLGWALNAGGMITRSVRGGPDEGVYNAGTNVAGYYRDSGITKMLPLPYPVNGVINGTKESERAQFYAAVSSGQGDAEPDLFTFNFNGYGGKFVFDENRIPRLLADQDLDISVNYAGGNFDSWVVTTADGAKYYFGEGGVQEINTVTSSAAGQDNNSLRPATWLLTRIVYPNTKDTVYFNYTPETYTYYDLGQETKIYTEVGPDALVLACSVDFRPTNVYKTTVSGYRLVNIKTRNYKVVFGVNTSTPRQDLVLGASNYPYLLDSVKVYSSQNQCLKQYVLSHSYFTSSTANNMMTPVLSFMGNDVSDAKRLKLTSVQELSGDGTISKPPYTMSYEETYQLPRRLSYDIDHWGFSNNYAGNANVRFTPKVFHSVCNNIGGSQTPANRDPKWPDMQQFTIKSIKDPLGVLTAFQFECHRSSLMMPNDMVGGLRIKKITATDSVSGQSNVRVYSYGSGGTLYKVPQYLFSPNNEFYLGADFLQADGFSYQGYIPAYGNRVLRCLIKQSQSIVPLQDFQGNHIGYSSVRETFGPSGEGGYNVYSFMADQLPKGNSRLDMANYTAYATVRANSGDASGIFGNGHFNDISPQDLVYYGGYDVDDYYPAAPSQVDLRRGQALGEETYDSAGLLLHEVQNYYTQTYHEDALIRGFKFFKSLNSTENFPNPYGSGNYNQALTYYKVHTGVSHPSLTISNDYKDGKVFSSTTYYKYESPYHTLKTQDSTMNSTGDVIVTKNYYSFDYANTATADNIFGKMKAHNMLLPVATRTWKNNQLLNGTVTLYKDFAANSADTFINPSKIYALETSAPLTTTQAGESVAFAGLYSTLLPNSYFKEKASFNVDGTTGKITEQKLVNDKTQTIIWDNALSLPLAQAENALATEVAYASFETAATGNWSYNTASVTTDATAPTGSKAYDIAGGLSKSGLNSAQKYILSYWLKSGGSVTVTGGTQSSSLTGRTRNGWTYKQVTIAGTTSISLSGSGSIDEVRLHPALSLMTTYTYDGLLRLVAQCSPNNTLSYYEYDSMNRLVDIKDQYGNVLKTFEYNYGSASR